MRGAATNTAAHCMGVTVQTLASKEPTANASTTGTGKRQKNCEPVRAVVCNSAAHYTGVIIRRLVSRRHTANANKDKRLPLNLKKWGCFESDDETHGEAKKSLTWAFLLRFRLVLAMGTPSKCLKIAYENIASQKNERNKDDE